MKSRLQRLILGLAVLAGITVAVLDRWIDRTNLPPLVPETSRTVLDRDGELLRAYAVADGRWRLPVRPSDVDPAYIRLLIAFEDKRFYSHPGVDPLAMLRAFGQALWHGRIVSGGSTLTMQAARLLEEGDTGALAGKIRQIRVALALERHLTKVEILGLYLQLAPFGGNIEGVRSASLTWFGKEPGRLTPAQAALLVALPQSPELRRPDRHPDLAALARKKVLQRSVAAGILPFDEAVAAGRESLPEKRLSFPMLAPHLSDRLLAATATGSITTTIDATLQASLESLLHDAVQPLDPRLSASLIVAEHHSGEILAEIGSADFLDATRLGFVDMTRAIRSPGSTLKPLIYGLAFEAGIAHPETLVDDRPTSFGSYAPQNFDRRYRGTITAREALQLSLNIPAVALLDAVGPAQLLARLRRAGAAPVLPAGRTPGLAIGLGGLGLSLHDLVAVYAAIARSGQTVVLHDLPGGETGGPTLLLENAAWQVADILSGVPPPSTGATGQIAFKTGTSYGSRDAWAIGFDGRHVIGVWMGRADGAAMPGVLGADLAAPLLFEAFSRLPADPVALPAPPSSVLTVSTSGLPQHLRHFRSRGMELASADLEITFPPDGARLEMAGAGAEMVLKARNGKLPIIWMVNGQPLTTGPLDWTASWLPQGRGFARIAVIDATGAAARASIFVE